MALSENMTPRAQRSALALIMLAVLLAGTGVAWVISARRSAGRPGELWYLITDQQDGPVGWQVVQRQEEGAGGQSGYKVLGADKQAPSNWSTWRLNADATQGSYASSMIQKIQVSGRIALGSTITSIGYDGQTVTVSQMVRIGDYILEDRHARQLPVDESYIAEGRLWPTIAKVAKTGQAVTGTMVRDEQMDLAKQSIEPLHTEIRTIQDRQLTLKVVAVTWGADEGEPSEAEMLTRYYVDEDGAIHLMERVEGGRITSKRELVDLAEIRRRFPSAPGRRRTALEEAKRHR